MISFPGVGHHAKEGPSQTASLCLLYFKVPFSFFFFSCGKAFLLVFRSFSEIVSLYVVVILVCP